MSWIAYIQPLGMPSCGLDNPFAGQLVTGKHPG